MLWGTPPFCHYVTEIGSFWHQTCAPDSCSNKIKVSLNEDEGLGLVFQEAELQGSLQKSGEALGDLKINIKYLSHASLSLQCFHLAMHYMKGTGK